MGKVQDEYSRVAPVYDLLLHPWLAGMRRETASLLSDRGVYSVVDLCCGTGAQCRRLAEQGLTACGVDDSPSMLRQARQKKGSCEEYYLEDAAATHFPERAFDAAIISFALHEKPRQQQADILSEARRIVSIQGLLALVDFRPHAAESLPFGWLVRLVERGMGRAHYRHFQAFLQAGGLPALLSENGLETFQLKAFSRLPAELRLARNR